MKKRYIKDVLYWALGVSIYAAAVAMVFTPNNITPGGFTGVALVLHRFTGLSTGTLIALFNIPLFIIAFKKMGGGFIIKTVAVTFLLSLTLSIFEVLLPKYVLSPILASVFGGIAAGFGLSLIMLRGATTGGVEIIATLVNEKKNHISVGRVIMVFDFCVCALSALVYGNIESALYSLISIYAASRLIDGVLYGADRGKMLLIISSKGNEMCKTIGRAVGRGATYIPARGGYTGEDRGIVLCAVRGYEVSGVLEIVYSIDGGTFTTVTDAGQIIGQGFKKY